MEHGLPDCHLRKMFQRRGRLNRQHISGLHGSVTTPGLVDCHNYEKIVCPSVLLAKPFVPQRIAYITVLVIPLKTFPG